ncbi:MAG TPA: phosphate ABC transporter substrate-binding protein PstS [Methylocella sp.]|nr:phosphate ABC transporter substrate-binding protein PstS [Methylocella sp.]
MLDRFHPIFRACFDRFVAAIAVWLLGASLLVSLLTLSIGSGRAETIALSETGSTLLFPLFNVWASEYVKTHPDVTLNTAATGSGAGISQAISGEVQIGASDAFMSDSEVRRHPEILNVALAISAQLVVTNIPGLNSMNLKLDGPVLAGIYSGKIHAWDDKAIAALNPGVALPHKDIVPVRRGEESGDTFIFTQYLSFSTESWENKYGFGNKIAWPNAPGELEAIGNAGMVEKLRQTPYSIGYVGISLYDDIAKAGLGVTALKSYSGEFLLATPETIASAAAALGPRTPPDERLTLVNAPGANAYPLVNYEYAIVSKNQPNPALAQALRKFLLWAAAPCESNDKFIGDAHFIPLPAHIWVLSHDQIMAIKTNGS